MFDPTSRYAATSVAHVDEAGREVAYGTRRFVTDPDVPLLGHIVVRQADRPDHLARESYGDATQWWRLADRARVRRAGELTETVGRRLEVPAPTPPPEVV